MNDAITHQQLLEVFLLVGLPLIGMMVATLVKYGRNEYEHRLMWRDFQKRHNIPNGNGNGTEPNH
jgi:hypothetical protein